MNGAGESTSLNSDEASRRLILGLGNPGERYTHTRHNVGFRVVQELAQRLNIELREGECNSILGHGEGLTLALPQTFMNRSGYAARCLVEVREFKPTEILVVYDEIHLPLGHLRLRRQGSPAGHRGMESIVENLGSDQVHRLRMGIAEDSGPPSGGEDLVRFVLKDFPATEQERVEAMIVRAADACAAWAQEGIEAAMQSFNGPPPTTV